MVGEEVVANATGELVDLVIPAIMERLNPFMAIFKVAGIALLAYIAYLFIRVFFNWRFKKRVKRMEKKLDSVDRKLDFVLKLLKKKEAPSKEGKKKKK